MLKEALPCLTNLRCDFRQPNRRFNRFDLAEEWTNAAEIMVAPMLKQARSFWCDTPIVGVWQPAPLVHLQADGINNCGVVVALLGGRKTSALVKEERCLIRRTLALYLASESV